MRIVLPVLCILGCGEALPLVVSDPMPPGGAWADVSLTLTGPAANKDKRKVCTDEARQAGIRLREGAPIAAALYLADDGNRLSFADGRPERMLGKWTTPAVCRVALAMITRLDERVRQANGQAPPNCRMLGTVDGEDRGYAFFVVQMASYEAAVASMQFAALRLGGNFISVDVVRQVGLITTLNGRAFDCGAAPPATTAPNGQQI
jgi:hypothetical protein